MSQRVSRDKPLLRGVSHHWAFFVTLLAGSLLVVSTRDSLQRWGCVTFVASLAFQFGVSALYHRPTWNASTRRWLRRLDHCAIFILIAGTMTPIALQLDAPARTWLLAIFWTGAAVGVLRALIWIDAPKPFVALLAIALGWAGGPFLPGLKSVVGGATLAWLVGGGIIYAVGGAIYALKRPDPWPRIFGYHEVFHALVVLAAVCHFVVVARVTHRE